MSEDNNHPVQQKRGVISKTLDLIFKIIGILLFSAVVSICVEWIGMAFFYPDEGYSHAQEMMQKELSYLGNSIEEDGTNMSAVNTASGAITSVVDFVFIDSGLYEGLAGIRESDLNDGKVVSMAKELMARYFDYLMAAVYILIMFFVRLGILILSIPAFLLFAIVGICDGLMQRDIRRWQGGNESGFIYHWAKRFAMPILIITWILYLAIPNSIHPNFIITPFAVLFGLVLMVMSSKFKKYL